MIIIDRETINRKPDPLLSVTNLNVHYPIRKGVFARTVGHVKAVNDVSFEVAPGETVGIVGESGCGKSSTGRALIRLEQATSGTVEFRGEDITHVPESRFRGLRRDMQMVFQDPYSALNPSKRIGDLLAEPLIVHKLVRGRAAVRDQVTAMLETVGLTAQFAHRYPHELSGGQRQRVVVARALTTSPQLLICDEPVSALDVSIQAQILNLLKDLQADLGLAYIFITHGLGAVKYISDRILVMYLGHIVESAPTADLFANPRHPYTRILLNAYPVPDPRLRSVRERIVVTGEVPSPAKPPSGCTFHTRCPFAQEICSVEAPAPSGGLDHTFACHFPLPLGSGLTGGRAAA